MSAPSKTNVIFYFTGSGNSLSVARGIAEELGNTSLVSIPKAMSEDNYPMGDYPMGDRVGFVFPTYAYGLPRMVREFAARVRIPKNAYVFAVASSCGIPGRVLPQLDRLLKKTGSALHSGFCVLDKRSSLIQDPDNDGMQQFIIRLNRNDYPEDSKSRINEIALTVAAEKRHPLESSNRVINFAGGILNPLALASFQKMASNFHTNGACKGCGTCVSLCPRNNIRMEQGQPVWGDDCEMCHACIQWCPHEAVEYGDITKGLPRYRNANITLEDMLLT